MSEQFPFADRMDRESQALLLLQQAVHELREIKRILTRRELGRVPRSSPDVQRQADQIKAVCAAFYKTDLDGINSRQVPANIVLARHMAAWFVKDLLNVTDREVDRLFGRSIHFAHYALPAFKRRLETDARVRADKEKLARELDRLWFGKAEPSPTLPEPTLTTEAQSPQRNGMAV